MEETRKTISPLSILSAFYRCPTPTARVDFESGVSSLAGYFSAADGLTCFGHTSAKVRAATTLGELPELRTEVVQGVGEIRLPFDPAEVVENLRFEKYIGTENEKKNDSIVRRLYYLLRPLMPVDFRKHLQRLSLRGWDRISFPSWPVDRTVDRLHEWLLAVSMQAAGETEIPFIWFWPEGRSACAAMTHDVETAAGRDFCGQLMDVNDGFGIKSSFQVVPEDRYEVPARYLDSIRKEGFEVNIHDLNHDGHLFDSHEQFQKRVAKINAYGKKFGARGFRSAVLYRHLEWMNDLEFAYDMSVPNIAHLDPQRGGCCTVMPYFVGDLVEIPVTATQDYSLFNILSDYSTELWRKQVSTITGANGMATFIIHPDYVIEQRAQKTYEELLRYLAELRETQNLWIALPGEINDWWRARNEMQLVHDGSTWRVVGEGSERARVAYARLEDGKLIYSLQSKVNAGAPNS